jgi:hypothetical protein
MPTGKGPTSPLTRWANLSSAESPSLPAKPASHAAIDRVPNEHPNEPPNPVRKRPNQPVCLPLTLPAGLAPAIAVHRRLGYHSDRPAVHPGFTVFFAPFFSPGNGIPSVPLPQP